MYCRVINQVLYQKEVLPLANIIKQVGPEQAEFSIFSGRSSKSKAKFKKRPSQVNQKVILLSN